jgi:hypothetical protein
MGDIAVVQRRLIISMADVPWAKPVSIVVCTLSVVACIYLAALITQVLRTGRPMSCTTLRTVRLLAITDLFMVAKGLWMYAATHREPPAVCNLVGALSQFVLAAHASLNFVIALDVFRMVRDPLKYKPETWFRRNIGGALAISMATALAPLFVRGDNGYTNEGEAGQLCWLQGGMVLLFYAMLWSAWVWCAFVVVYFSVKKWRALRKKQRRKAEMQQRLLLRMVAFSSMFVLISTPQSVVRLCFFADAGWCSGNAAHVAARLFSALIGVVDLAVWYKPVCAQAAREGVQIWSLDLLRPARWCQCCSARRGQGYWRHGSSPDKLFAEELHEVEIVPTATTTNPGLDESPLHDADSAPS